MQFCDVEQGNQKQLQHPKLQLVILDQNARRVTHLRTYSAASQDRTCNRTCGHSNPSDLPTRSKHSALASTVGPLLMLGSLADGRLQHPAIACTARRCSRVQLRVCATASKHKTSQKNGRFGGLGDLLGPIGLTLGSKLTVSSCCAPLGASCHHCCLLLHVRVR